MIKSKSAQPGVNVKLTADQLQKAYKQNRKGLLEVLNRCPGLADSIRLLGQKAEVAVMPTATRPSGGKVRFSSTSDSVFSRVRPVDSTSPESGGFHEVGASKKDPSASARDSKLGNRSASVPMRLGHMSAETKSAPTTPGLMSAETIFTDILRDFWWPKKYKSEHGEELDFPTYQEYTDKEYTDKNRGQEYLYLRISGDAKFAFSERYKKPIELLEKVHEFLNNDANALAKIRQYIESTHVNQERRKVLSAFSAQLNSVYILDDDLRLKMLKHLSLELFLKQKIRVLKERETKIKEVVNRTPLEERIKMTSLSSQLREINERRKVLSAFSAQLNSVDILDDDLRLKMLKYLFLKQKIRVLKERETKIKEVVNRTPFEERIKMRSLSSQLREINTRISETLGKIATLEQRVTQLGLINNQGDHEQSISPLYDLIKGSMPSSEELSKRSLSAPPLPGAIFPMDMW